MDDKKIVQLYFKRDYAAIEQSQQKYGNYCKYVANNILHNFADSEECVNDTWLKAWNSIPPHKPQKLQYFLAKITRNLAINKYNYNHAQKRDGRLTVVMDEFWQCLPDGATPIEDEVVLKHVINAFLAKLDTRTRIIFLQRYWYCLDIAEIAHNNNISPSSVTVTLHRTRNRFKSFLKKEGVFR